MIITSFTGMTSYTSQSPSMHRSSQKLPKAVLILKVFFAYYVLLNILFRRRLSAEGAKPESNNRWKTGSGHVCMFFKDISRLRALSEAEVAPCPVKSTFLPSLISQQPWGRLTSGFFCWIASSLIASMRPIVTQPKGHCSTWHVQSERCPKYFSCYISATNGPIALKFGMYPRAR